MPNLNYPLHQGRGKFLHVVNAHVFKVLSVPEFQVQQDPQSEIVVGGAGEVLFE